MDEVQNAIYRLVQRFVERQKIVGDAIEELRPDLRGLEDGLPDEERLRRKLMRIRVPTQLWGKDQEWECFVHGHGCRMTNRKTGEMLDWDVDDLHVFHGAVFAHWLAWIMNAQPNHEACAILTPAIGQLNPDQLRTWVFEHFAESQLIVCENPPDCNLYRLL